MMIMPVFPNNDLLIRGLSSLDNIRIVYTEANQTLSDAIKIHDTDPLASLFLGQAIIASILTIPLLKGDERHSIRWQYEGELGRLLCEVTEQSELRAIPQKSHLMDKNLSEEMLFGNKGTVGVVRSHLLNGKILNSGTISAGLMNVADDLALFFSLSDQVETEIILNLQFNPDPINPVQIARGFLIQAMPNADLTHFEKIRALLHTPQISAVLSDSKQDFASRINHICQLAEFASLPDLFPCPSPKYLCSCNKNRLIQSLLTLSQHDQSSLFEKENEISISCHFCNQKYIIKKNELL